MARIEQHLSRNIVALDGTASCAEAARLMTEKRVGSVGVRERGKIVGLVTERDLVHRVMGRGDPDKVPIREAMRQDVPNVGPDATEAECADLMRDHYTRHLLVTEGDNVVGVISMRDVISLMLDEKEWLIGQLERYISTGG